MKLDKKAVRSILWFIKFSVIGYLCFALPPLIAGKTVTPSDTPLFPYIFYAVNNLETIPTVIALLFVGIIIGLYKPEQWLLLGIGTISIFPIASIIEGTFAPSSHNLGPIELIIYALLAIPACLGAFLTKIISEKMRESEASKDKPMYINAIRILQLIISSILLIIMFKYIVNSFGILSVFLGILSLIYFLSVIGTFFNVIITWKISAIPPILVFLYSIIGSLYAIYILISNKEVSTTEQSIIGSIGLIIIQFVFTFVPSGIILLLIWKCRKDIFENNADKQKTINDQHLTE